MLIDYSHLHREVLMEDLPKKECFLSGIAQISSPLTSIRSRKKYRWWCDDGWNDNYYDDVDNIDKIDDKNEQKHTNI